MSGREKKLVAEMKKYSGDVRSKWNEGEREWSEADWDLLYFQVGRREEQKVVWLFE